MRALVATRHGGPEVLEFHENWGDPEPASGQVLIRVVSAGINFADVMALAGKYPAPPPPFVPGVEVAGYEVASGRPVVALVASGGYAELVAADPDLVYGAGGFDLAEAGCYPLVTLTCYLVLKRLAKLDKGESVLVTAGAGGVGTTAIQTARAMGAGLIVAIASTPEKRAYAISHGADLAIGYEDDFPACDVTVDGVGGDAFQKAYRSAPPFGRIVMLGASSGRPPVFPDFGELRNRGVALMPFSFRSLRTARPEYVDAFAPEALALVASGQVRPPVGHSLQLRDGAQGLRMLAGRETLGKVVLHP